MTHSPEDRLAPGTDSQDPPPTTRDRLTPRSLWTFFVGTFALSWGSGIVMVAFQDQVESLFGPMGYTNPVFIFLVYGPAIVGTIMVLRAYGFAGFRSFLRRVTLWRMPAAWWLLLLVGMPAVFYAGAAVTGHATDPFPFDPWYTVLPALLAMFLIGPIEEFGWRGVALPLLQRRFTPLVSSLVLGTIVAVWHTPSFFLSGTKQAAWAFWPFFFGVIAITVILTPMFNAAGGSLLVAGLFHAQMNNPIWPDAQPWDMVFFVVVAVIVTVVNRRAMLDRTSAAISVLAPEPQHEAVDR